jgi:hypothetical protein
MNIREYIPKGQNNAISKKNLCRRTGLSDRELRHCVEKANQEGEEPIICLLDGRGYFIPLPSEREQAIEYMRSEYSRVKKTIRKIHNIEKWLSNIGQMEMEL